MTQNFSPGDTWRFPTALGAAIALHALLVATWDSLPFAGAAENQAPCPIQTGLNEISLRFVAPPPPPAKPTPEPERTAQPQPHPEPKPIAIPRPEVVTVTPAKRTPAIPAPRETPEEPPAPKIGSAPEPPRIQPEPAPAPAPRPDPLPAQRPEKSASGALFTGPPAPPSYRSNPKPPYPPDARRAGAQGTTYLRVGISPSGDVDRVTVVKSSGHASLDASALRTVSSQWRFHPARRGGVAVSAVVTVPVRFQLR